MSSLNTPHRSQDKEFRKERSKVCQANTRTKEVPDKKSRRNTPDHSEKSSEDDENHTTALLINSLKEARKRKEKQHSLSKLLDGRKLELHKDIHQRALSHMLELQKLEAHVERLTKEACALRKYSKRKDMVMNSLKEGK